MDNKYEIQLGVSLDTSDLKQQINQINNGKHKIDLGVNLKVNDIRDRIKAYNNNANNIKVKLGVKLDTSDIKQQIKNLNLSGLSKAQGMNVAINTESLEKSLNEVKDIISDIRTSLGSLSGDGMKDIVSSINQMATALGKAENESDSLVKSLSALSKKDFSFNFGFNMKKSASQISSEQGDLKRNAISQLKQQAQALEDYLDSYYKVTQQGEGAVKLIQGTNAFRDYWELSTNIGDTKTSLKQQVNTYKQYIDLIMRASKIKGVDLSSITSGFSKSAEDISKETSKAANDVEQFKQAFKGLFGSGVDGENLSRQLDSVVADLKEIKTSMKDLSSGVSLDGLIQSFNRLSDVLDKLDANFDRIKNAFNGSFIDSGITQSVGKAEQKVADVSDSVTSEIVKNEERKQQAYQETKREYDKISRDISLIRDAEKGIDFRDSFDSYNGAAKEAEKHFQELLADEKAVVSVLEKTDGSHMLESFTVNIKRASGEVENLRYALQKIDDENYGDFIFDGASSNDKNVQKQYEARIKKANDLQIELDKIKSEYTDKGSAKPIKNLDYINVLDEQYEKVEKAILDVKNADDSTFESMVSNAKREKVALESMIKVYRNADNVSNSLKGTDFTSGVKIRIEELGKLKAQASDYPQMARTIEELDRAIEGIGDKPSLDSFTDQLKVARAELAKVKAETIATNRKEKVGINVSGVTSQIANIQRISPEINEFKTVIDGAEVSVESLLNDLSRVNTAGDFSVVKARFKAFEDAAESAGVAITEVVTKASTIDKIEFKISDTGFNGFTQEVARAHADVEKLDGTYDDLTNSLKELDIAMERVYSAKASGDIQALANANKEYEASLKRVTSQLKLYQQEEDRAFKNEMLDQKRTALNSDMEIWLKENTRATRDFGEEIRKLQSSLNGLDDKGLRLAGKQFTNIKKQAQAMGKTGLTVFDQLKAKAAQYASYLSAAEIFMYAEQAIRSMFEQVKLIDSAMTELKKVTDETNASYDKFLTNAATRAREIGTTIDGLVSSTADFARLGYNFVDSQGLAEVANIYAVVGDEIEGVEGATESLISTMAAFKDSATGMSNTDFAMSIIDKFNEIGKLIA